MSDYIDECDGSFPDDDIVHCTLCGGQCDLCIDCVVVEAPLPPGKTFNDDGFGGIGQLKLCPECVKAVSAAIDQHFHDAGVFEHGEREGDWCAECNAAYKMARVDPENATPNPTNP